MHQPINFQHSPLRTDVSSEDRASQLLTVAKPDRSSGVVFQLSLAMDPPCLRQVYSKLLVRVSYAVPACPRLETKNESTSKSKNWGRSVLVQASFPLLQDAGRDVADIFIQYGLNDG